MNLFAENIHVGTLAALMEINRRNQAYDRAERRLAEKLKPGLLTPLNLTHRNGQDASDAVIKEIRTARSF
jgi:hypothetical protein